MPSTYLTPCSPHPRLPEHRRLHHVGTKVPDALTSLGVSWCQAALLCRVSRVGLFLIRHLCVTGQLPVGMQLCPVETAPGPVGISAFPEELKGEKGTSHPNPLYLPGYVVVC